MAAEDIPPSDRISAAITKLIPAAERLQSANEDLSKPVAELEDSIKKLNLGVACWTHFHKQEGANGEFADWAVGYGRHQDRWGILVMQTTGFRSSPDSEANTIWFFRDAPRFIKPKGVDALPELVEGLVAVAEKTTGKLLKKVPVATSLAAAAAKHFEKKKG